MGVGEQLRIVKMKADRSRRSVVSRILHSPLLRWRYGQPAATHLVIVPQDLRTADPSFWREIELGQFGLAGTIAELHGYSPFEIDPPNEAWLRELHGFGWLRNLAAAGNDQARDKARELVVEWIQTYQVSGGIPWEPAVTGRRLISWISHAGLLLDGADPKTYDQIAQGVGMQLVRLSATWRDGAHGYPRLLALIALVLADLSIAGHDSQLDAAERALSHELKNQIVPDGGHISRNSSVLVELMLDLLPLRQCFKSRERQPPEILAEVVRKIPMMLRFMRLGDGTLGRFNGVTAALPVGLATVLAYDDRQEAQPGLAPKSRYGRLSRAGTVVLIDGASPKCIEAASEAQAGCLSFEMSAGSRAMIVNGGAPSAADAGWRAVARATANHNTLCLAESSSAELLRNKRLSELAGAETLKGPAVVEARVIEIDGDLEFSGWHDGYRDKFGLIHSRKLLLAQNGRRLIGVDSLAAPRVRMRLRREVPFAIHFHLHPDAGCKQVPSEHAAEIRLKDGQVWRLHAPTFIPSVEDSTYFADSAGPRESLQIVLRGATSGETDVTWTIEAVT